MHNLSNILGFLRQHYTATKVVRAVASTQEGLNPGSSGNLLCAVCMSSPCLCGFSPGTRTVHKICG